MNAAIKAAYWAQMQSHNLWLKNAITAQLGETLSAPILNMPIILPPGFMETMLASCDAIVSQIKSGELMRQSAALIDSTRLLGNINVHPNFLSIDFAAADANGKVVPQLIELQGFPSIIAFGLYAGAFYASPEFSALQHSWVPKPYLPEQPHSIFKKTVLGKYAANEVWLIDYQPETQATRFDFMLTEKLTGVKRLCISEVQRTGNQLYTQREGKSWPIKRIYNRLIFTSLAPELQQHVRLLYEGADVEWAAHPDWFSLISKASLPGLYAAAFTSALAPAVRATIPWSARLSDVNYRELALENYIVKPLLDYAGKGLQLNPTIPSLDSITRPQDYLIQQRVNYTPAVCAPSDNMELFSEYRVMLCWPDDAPDPVPVAVMVRVNTTPKMGVSQHQRSPWTGITIALHPVASHSLLNYV